MKTPILEAWARVEKPVIGVLHAPALPGSPDYAGDLGSVLSALLRDAEALVEGGVHGLLLENFGDRPFFPGRVPAHTATHMTALAVEVRGRFDVPLGVSVLRNDAQTALAVAHAAGAHFIRVNVLSGARVSDQGILQAVAHDLFRERRLLGAESIQVFADVNVKHSVPLANLAPDAEARHLVERGKADALIVTGPATGEPPDVREIVAVHAAVGTTPVLAGSGVTPELVETYRSLVDGFIVGSYFKTEGKVKNPVETVRVRSFLESLR